MPAAAPLHPGFIWAGGGAPSGHCRAATGLVTSLSGNLHLLGKFSLTRKLSSCSLYLRRQGRRLRELLFSFARGRGEDEVQWNSFSHQLFIHQVYTVHLQCDRLSVAFWCDRQGGQDFCLETSVVFLKRHLENKALCLRPGFCHCEHSY